MTRRVSLAATRRSLTVIWFSGAALPALIVMAQTVGDRYSGRSEEAWAWLLPTILPTLSLIVGALVMDVRQGPTRRRPTVDSFVAKFSKLLSIAYLLIVVATILMIPIAELYSATDPLTFLKMSNWWLAPLQGFVTAMLGALFASREES